MILYVGNKLKKHGYSPTSVETVGPLLKESGLEVICVSDVHHRGLRLIDMLFAVIRRAGKLNLVIIDTYSTLNFYYAVAVGAVCRVLKIPYLPVLRGGNLPFRCKTSPWLANFLFKSSAQNVAPSRYMANAFNELGYRSTVVPNFLQLRNYPFRLRNNIKPCLLWVRSFHKIYHPEMAVMVLKELKKSFPDARLCMIGPEKDGSLAVCKELTKKLGIENYVEFTGLLSKREWVEKAKEYDIFINTTTADNTPVSVLEAMALGFPVVSTNAGGLSFLLEDGDDAILVEIADTHAMVEAIIRLIGDSKLSNRLSRNARIKAENFDWETRVKKRWIETIEVCRNE